MRAACGRCCESKALAKQFHIPQDIPTAQFRLRAICEEQTVRRAVGFLAVAEHYTAQLKREGNYTLLASLPVQSDEQIFKVNLPHAQTEGFRDAASRVQQKEAQQMQPPLVFSFGLPRGQQSDLRSAECREHKVRRFEVSDFRVTASTTAL